MPSSHQVGFLVDLAAALAHKARMLFADPSRALAAGRRVDLPQVVFDNEGYAGDAMIYWRLYGPTLRGRFIQASRSPNADG